MITLHLLQYLQDNGFGTINTSLHFEVLPLDKDGVAIFSRGGPMSTGRRSATQRFDLYSRGKTNILGRYKLDQIAEFFSDHAFEICDLPPVPDISELTYAKCRITTLDNVENLGLDDNDRVIFRLAAQVTYEKI